MAKHGSGRVGAAMLACVLGGGLAWAQQATDKDEQFLKDTAQDSNFEIKSGQLALRNSSSADVRQYAAMVIRDHTGLLQQVRTADSAVQVKPEGEGSMSLSDDATYAKLKLLKGDSFDQSYIKGLIQGNQDSLNQGKAEAAATAVPAIKSLAERRVTLDTKHAAKAEQLAAAHKVAGKS